MKTAAIICEYNPFHRGHMRQFDLTREALGADAAIVCLMSGCFVQRGAPAVFDRRTRAAAALACGADLVLENPVTNVLRSAEGYALGSIELLGSLGCIDALSFGTEQGSAEQLTEAAALLESEAFSAALRPYLDEGLSFASARQRALEDLGGDGELLSQPNSILGVEYCKALLRTGTRITPLPVQRTGAYHAQTLEEEAPSASAIRAAMEAGSTWTGAVPGAAAACYQGAQRHSWRSGERAVLAVLRSMPRERFAELPHGEEGLWSRFCRATREEASLQAIREAAKSKRYAMTRIDRLLTCAYLGIDRETLGASAPYVRVLGFTERGQKLLRSMKEEGTACLVNAGALPPDRAYYALEQRVSDLYALCAQREVRFGAEEALRAVRPENISLQEEKN